MVENEGFYYLINKNSQMNLGTRKFPFEFFSTYVKTAIYNLQIIYPIISFRNVVVSEIEKEYVFPLFGTSNKLNTVTVYFIL